MRQISRLTVTALSVCLLPLLSVDGRPAAAAGDELGRQVLSSNDGWGAAEGGTTGGAEASAENVFTVRSREEFVRALGGDNATNGQNRTPAIIYVEGTIDLGTDANGRALTEADFADPAYSFDQYVKTYDPQVWGRKALTGPLEEARQRSQENQAKHVVINVGSNKSIIGVGDQARIIHGNLMLREVDNVIIRNIAFEDAYDLFPSWDPAESQNTGYWNSEYDLVSLVGATHVWVDHNTFSDGARPDKTFPVIFDRRVQHHDGTLDIITGSSYVTASWNHFHDHDKTNLVGSSDNRTDDDGKLKVTFHHNFWENVMQRAPRVRYGQVHVYNNYHLGSKNHETYPYYYSHGVGTASKMYSELNYFDFGDDVHDGEIIFFWRGTTYFDQGSLHNGKPVQLLRARNALHPEIVLREGADWKPTLVGRIDPVEKVPELVRAGAGAGKL